MTVILIILILALAAAGGFLGNLLEAAGWIIAFLVVIGAVLGFLASRWVKRLLDR